ncbi:hypothetical protein [Eudoraea sp.]|uniref:hypothetical protein n=1 Tax=Eudoraea sp. TaxID=1979955 RepID=UPI003C738477
MKKTNSPLRRVIVDYKKLTHDILDLLVTKYPDGYDEDNIITFKNAQNEVVECVEVRTNDTVYLVKISKRLVAAMEDFDPDEDQDDNDDNEFDNHKEEENLEMDDSEE